MAHFAELNSSNEVLQVIIVSNDDVDANGGDLHVDAETFVESIVPYLTDGVAWKQTSYNRNFRKNYAGAGTIYHPFKDKFLAPQPFPSWYLDNNDDWQPLVNYPDTYKINGLIANAEWDEANRRWIGKTFDETTDPITETDYVWNDGASQWQEV